MKNSNLSISTQFSFLLLLIIATNAAAYYLIFQNIYLQELKSQAQTVVSNVDAFGKWVAQNGRIWVKDKNENSFLSEQIFIQQDSQGEQQSVHFYSKNPALAQREFSEVVAKSSSPAKFRMTSHNVMNPSNSPDHFERIALEAVRNTGVSEYSSFENGQFRYAKAVYHTAACIGCHGDARKAPSDVIKRYGAEHGFGFKEGDVAGVISVTITAQPLLSKILNFFGAKEIALIVLSVLVAFWFVRTAIISPLKTLTDAAHDLSTGKDASIVTLGMEPDSSNEVHQLTLALSRMRNSTNLAIKKMREAKTAASDILSKAKMAVAKAREESQHPEPVKQQEKFVKKELFKKHQLLKSR